MRSTAPAASAVALPNDLREHQQPNVAGVVMNLLEDMSMINLSRFDVDLLSKTAENAILTCDAIDSIEAGKNVSSANDKSNGVEIPLTIRTRDKDVDDVDDDLTEATAPREDDGDRSRTSNYFSMSSNDQATVKAGQPNLENYHSSKNDPSDDLNCNANPPHKGIANFGITNAETVLQPSPQIWAAKSGASNGPPMPRGSMEVSEPPKKRASEGELSHRRSSVARVSLSPLPCMNVEDRISSNTSCTASTSQARVHSPTNNADYADDDNSIVIPCAPATAAGKETGISFQTGAEGEQIGTINNLPRDPPASTVNKFSTTLLHRQRSSIIPKKNGVGRFKASIEKVQFVASGTRPSAAVATKSDGRSIAQVGASSTNLTPLSKVSTSFPNSTAITPDHRRSGVKEVSNNSGGDTITPVINQTPDTVEALASTVMYDSIRDDRYVSELPAITAGPKAMEIEPQAEELIVGRRPRSKSIYSPPPLTNTESVTPKASNVNPPVTATNNASERSYTKPNSAFHADENFDELLSQFVNDIQEGTDIFERGKNDLLELEVDLSHAFAAVLRYKDDYNNLLDEIEGVMAMAENIMSDVITGQSN
jgi:hypothetical protein